MTAEYVAAALTAAVFLALAVRLWRQTHDVKHEMFHFERRRHVRRTRATAIVGMGLAAVTVGVATWHNVGLQRQHSHDAQQLVTLRQRNAELELALMQRPVPVVAAAVAPAPAALPAVLPVAAPAATPAPAPTPVAKASSSSDHWSRVTVNRALVRSGPAGTARFTLAEGTRVRPLGPQAQVRGDLWVAIADEAGRSGWIAIRLLEQRISSSAGNPS